MSEYNVWSSHPHRVPANSLRSPVLPQQHGQWVQTPQLREKHMRFNVAFLMHHLTSSVLFSVCLSTFIYLDVESTYFECMNKPTNLWKCGFLLTHSLNSLFTVHQLVVLSVNGSGRIKSVFKVQNQEYTLLVERFKDIVFRSGSPLLSHHITITHYLQKWKFLLKEPFLFFLMRAFIQHVDTHTHTQTLKHS